MRNEHSGESSLLNSDIADISKKMFFNTGMAGYYMLYNDLVNGESDEA